MGWAFGDTLGGLVPRPTRDIWHGDGDIMSATAPTSSESATPTSGAELEWDADPQPSMSVVDPEWEVLDPNPQLHALFLAFNDQYFYGRLAGVEVKWSPRMTLCAGVCSFDGQLCSIRCDTVCPPL